VWQNCGWGTIIYLAALAGGYRAARGGHDRRREPVQARALHRFPQHPSTATILLVLNSGKLMAIGFEKAFLMQNMRKIAVSEIIPTYAYKVGLASASADFSYSTTISLFNSAVNLILIFVVNRAAKRWGETSLW
jgi:putative aldouronate transport system permease protein